MMTSSNFQRMKKYYLFYSCTYILICLFLWVAFTDNYFSTPDLPLPEAKDFLIKRLSIKPFMNISFNESTTKCIIPDFDPFDESIIDLYEKISKPYNCTGWLSFIQIQSRNVLTINKTLLRNAFNAEENDITCKYLPIVSDRNDNFVKYGKYTPLLFNVPIDEEFLFIKCRKGYKIILRDVIALFPTGGEKMPKTKTFANKTSMNILIIGIDSISRLNSIRHLPKTRNFLESLNAIELKMYNKVGTNSFPNLLALLAGKDASTFDRNIYYDDVDFIWKNFSKSNYKTIYFEDMTEYATFNYYGGKGFQKKPVDHYFRPLSMALDVFKRKSMWKEDFYCFRNKLKAEFYWDYIKLVTNSINPASRFFAFAFIADVTHQLMNNAGYLDEPALNLLEDLMHSGTLENTFLFFFSDHGINFGPIRETLLGHYESNLPMAYLVFPKWFYEKYPQIYENLTINKNRLTTHFDVHETLRHILSLTENESDIDSHSHGQSLFDVIPDTRTCRDAGIGTEWCSCFSFLSIDTTEELILNITDSLIEKINTLLLPVSNLCHNLTQAEVIDSKSYISSQTEIILIKVETIPGNALFEATVIYNQTTKDFNILDQINRINSFGNSSSCVSPSTLVNFCFCKDQ